MDVDGGGDEGVVVDAAGVGCGHAAAATSASFCRGDGGSTVGSPLRMVETRFAMRTLSICAMDIMFPWPRTCVAALMVTSGVSSSPSLSSSPSSWSYGLWWLGVGALGSTTMW